MDLVSGDKLAKMQPVEKIRFIIDEVKDGKILVLEKGLSYGEAAEKVGVHRMSIYWACYAARGNKHGKSGKTQTGHGRARLRMCEK